MEASLLDSPERLERLTLAHVVLKIAEIFKNLNALVVLISLHPLMQVARSSLLKRQA